MRRVKYSENFGNGIATLDFRYDGDNVDIVADIFEVLGRFS